MSDSSSSTPSLTEAQRAVVRNVPPRKDGGYRGIFATWEPGQLPNDQTNVRFGFVNLYPSGGSWTLSDRQLRITHGR